MLRVLRVESCPPKVRGIYTDGELTLNVAVFESGLVKSCESASAARSAHSEIQEWQVQYSASEQDSSHAEIKITKDLS
jgi:hypothetical protein